MNLGLPLDTSVPFPSRLKHTLSLEASFLFNYMSAANESPLSCLLGK